MSMITAPTNIWSERGHEWKMDTARPHRLIRTTDGMTIHPDHDFLYTPEFIAFVESETEWTTGEDWIKPPSEHREGIGMGTIECPNCKGNKYRWFRQEGKNTRLVGVASVRCICWLNRNYWLNWNKAIDGRFRHVRFATLAPLEANHVRLSVGRQQKIIDWIKANPESSYLLYGTYGSGKTHISVALHDYHLRKWLPMSMYGNRVYCPVMRAGVGELLDQHHAWKMRGENHNVPRPSIDVALIRDIVAQGDRPVLILDELDKLGGKPSEFKLETLFSLVDKTYAANGIVIATSNRDVKWFIDTWGEALGGPVLRRITNEGSAKKIRFEDQPA
ncbi:hypothetical protein HNQ77_002693 [Silvibacterium bohemicum]|uniref:AAA+ ATPase domain-containing protein n=1 Tax=Silvibacterium bohemicum TaxID=1577686 RepID=A0A841JWA3_9BACT|nr:ATP-binding protein [Silvibacterium bohemicum]MBB6144737.1 hypothetical protein [Silvibacterium bohemicum]